MLWLFKFKLLIVGWILNKSFYSHFLFSQIIKNCENDKKLGCILKIKNYDKKRFNYLVMQGFVEKDMSFFIKSILKSKYSTFFFPPTELSTFRFNCSYGLIYSSEKYENIIAFLENHQFKESEKHIIKKYLYRLNDLAKDNKEGVSSSFSKLFYNTNVMSVLNEFCFDLSSLIHKTKLKNTLNKF